MDTHYYRYLEPQNADQYVTKADYWVWYYPPGVNNPPRCTDVTKRPQDAKSAVVASPDKAFAAGDEMGLVNYTGGKDPIPPPPPPPWYVSLTDYLKQPAAQEFFNGVPRGTRA